MLFFVYFLKKHIKVESFGRKAETQALLHVPRTNTDNLYHVSHICIAYLWCSFCTHVYLLHSLNRILHSLTSLFWTPPFVSFGYIQCSLSLCILFWHGCQNYTDVIPAQRIVPFSTATEWVSLVMILFSLASPLYSLHLHGSRSPLSPPVQCASLPFRLLFTRKGFKATRGGKRIGFGVWWLFVSLGMNVIN